MNELLTRAIESLRMLPAEMQDDLACMLLQWVGEDRPVVQLTEAEHASFAASFAQAEQAEFATDDQLREIWAKHGV